MERFWNKVVTRGLDECWPWTAYRNSDGYGIFGIKDHRGHTTINAHRFALSQALGRPIVNGMHVLHSCPDRSCCNPAHLREGTNADNMRDKIAKGRQTRGEKHGTTKLTAAQVREIRASSLTQPELASKFGVHRNTIYYAKSRKYWKHIQ